MTRVLVGAVVVFAACRMFGQPAVPAPAFEVASIKPNASASGNSSTHSTRGQITMENVSLKQCIEMAFDVKDYSLSGPSWLDSVRFDIVAKPPSGSPPSRSPGFVPPDFQAMLQNLLADRFKLTVHREPRVLSAYALLVDKKGPKIRSVGWPIRDEFGTRATHRQENLHGGVRGHAVAPPGPSRERPDGSPGSFRHQAEVDA